MAEVAQRNPLAAKMLAQLKNPFDPRFIKCRVGATNKAKTKGIALFYLDAREVRKRLDEVCGIEGWSSRMDPVVDNGLIGMICTLSIKMPFQFNGKDVWVSKADTGEPSKACPLKGATSDALKRAAVNFGIGTYLYYIPNKWYEIDEYRQFKQAPELPSWALPRKDVVDWEQAAIDDYDPLHDINPEDMDFVDPEARELLTKAAAVRAEIVANLKNKKLES